MGLNLFSTEFFYKEGKGVSKDAPAKPPLIRFFEIYSIKFRHLCTSGLIYTGCAAVIALLSFFLSSYENILNIGDISLGGVISAFLGLWPIILFALPAASMSFLSRNIVREKSYFIWYDFWRMIKENWLGALILGVINLTLGIIGGYAVLFYLDKLKDGWLYYIPFFLVAMVCIVLLFASFYEFVLLVSFNLRTGTLLKYSVMIALANLPQTLIVFAVEGLTIAAFYGMFRLIFTDSSFANISLLALLIAVFMILIIPLFFYLQAFVAWPMIEKLLNKNESTEGTEVPDVEENEEITESDENTAIEIESIPENDDDTEDIEMVFYNGKMMRKDEVDNF